MWQRAFSCEELDDRGARLFRAPPRQIAVFRVDSAIYAIDNRCPHEGYPLVDGQVDDPKCQLTCAWHNWKFDLKNGDCVLGGDHVRNYPVKEEDGHVWVNVADPPIEKTTERVVEGLERAYEQRDFGRICREITRLHFAKIDPLLAVRKALLWSYDRFEFGTTHAYAAAADWLRRYSEYDGQWERQLICLAEVVDHIAFDALRQPPAPYAADATQSFTHDGLLEAVETENVPAAEAMIGSGLAAGRQWNDWEATYAEAALAHFNGFGHSAIYVFKMGQLIEQLGSDVHEWLALPLIRSLCIATREDLLPGFSTHADTVSGLLESGFVTSPGEGLTDPFPISTAKCHEWLLCHADSHTTEQLYEALLQGICKSLIHFDTAYGSSYERPVADNVGWLDFTHGITFANAVRILCSRYPHLWSQGLSQMACMLGRNYRFVDLDVDLESWVVDDEEAFWAQVRDTEIDHGFRDPTFSAHVIKTAVAVEEEMEVASPQCRKWLQAALNRFVHADIKQKHTRRLARQAVELVQRDYD